MTRRKGDKREEHGALLRCFTKAHCTYLSAARSSIDCVKMINEEHFISGSQDGYVCLHSMCECVVCALVWCVRMCGMCPCVVCANVVCANVVCGVCECGLCACMWCVRLVWCV